MHPLTRPAAWPLKVGAASVPSIKWAGAALWACTALLALIWLAGLVQDAFAGQLPAWIGAAATLGVVAWFVVTWQVIKQWFIQAADVTLSWHGPVLAADVTRRGHELPQGGFHVNEWHSAVQLHVVLDWQRWMLLRIRALNTREPREVFCWLETPQLASGQISPGGTSLHQLRSLLCLPPAWITQAEAQPSSPVGQGRHSSEAVASCAASGQPGLRLPRPVSSLFSARPSSSNQREVDTQFPPTEFLDEAWAQGPDDMPSKGVA